MILLGLMVLIAAATLRFSWSELNEPLVVSFVRGSTAAVGTLALLILIGHKGGFFSLVFRAAWLAALVYTWHYILGYRPSPAIRGKGEVAPRLCGDYFRDLRKLYEKLQRLGANDGAAFREEIRPLLDQLAARINSGKTPPNTSPRSAAEKNPTAAAASSGKRQRLKGLTKNYKSHGSNPFVLIVNAVLALALSICVVMAVYAYQDPAGFARLQQTLEAVLRR